MDPRGQPEKVRRMVNTASPRDGLVLPGQGAK